MGGGWTDEDLAVVRGRVYAAAALPGVEVEESDGHLGFLVRRKRFAWLLVDHHDDGRLALCVKAPPGEQEGLLARGDGYFFPAYLGSRGWVGVSLAPGDAPDWDEVASLLEQAWRMTASRMAVRSFDGMPR